jgi:hypothetical protein
MAVEMECTTTTVDSPPASSKTAQQSRGRKAQPNSFVPNLYKILNDQRAASVCTWDPTGTYFVVSAPDQMGPILKDYYKHDNWASFVRQLNTYGFWKKPDGSGYAIGHEFFLRMRPDLFEKISRRSTAREQHCKPEGSTEQASKRRRVESPDAASASALQQLSHGALLVLQLQALEDRIKKLEGDSCRKDTLIGTLADKVQCLERQNEMKDERLVTLEKRNPKQTKKDPKSPARGTSPLHNIHNQALSAALIAASGLAHSRYPIAPQSAVNTPFCVPPSMPMPMMAKIWAGFPHGAVNVASHQNQKKDENSPARVSAKA